MSKSFWILLSRKVEQSGVCLPGYDRVSRRFLQYVTSNKQARADINGDAGLLNLTSSLSTTGPIMILPEAGLDHRIGLASMPNAITHHQFGGASLLC
jgi:hypothetical protein